MNVSHQHAKTYKDESTNSTVDSHQLPIPLNWKVLVQPHQVTMKTKGGLHLPSISKDNEEYLTAHGRVAAMGDLAYRDRDTGDKWRADVCPQVGNRVTYGKYAGQKVTINGVRFLLLNDDELTSILPEDVDVTSYLAQ
jgi:co-chaperonin GroES (HSP10)|tara:strand:- start:1549 stop:1962 length:414 start_codon:yes stop_codon:yes gene_type:complete